MFLIWFSFLVLEEDSDEIKIGTSCKNGGCSKVYTVKFVLCHGSRIVIFEEEGAIYWFSSTNIWVPIMCWSVCYGLGLWTWIRDSVSDEHHIWQNHGINNSNSVSIYWALTVCQTVFGGLETQYQVSKNFCCCGADSLI